MTADEIAAWYKTKRPPTMGWDDLILLLNSAHPRTVFIKTLPIGATLVDVGAGDGGLAVFRQWPAPPRTDLRIYAYSLEKGSNFDAYDGFELGNWEAAPPAFPEISIDAVFCSHFIEHIADPGAFLEWAGSRLSRGGRLYVEWPSPFSTLLPQKEELVRRGVPVMISNFHDDASHKAIHDRAQLVARLSKLGFFVEHQGYVSLPASEDEVPAHAAEGRNDPYAVQLAFWSKTKWAQYIVAAKR